MTEKVNLKAKNSSSLWVFFLFNTSIFLGVFFSTNIDAIINNFSSVLTIRTSGILIAPLILFLVNGLLSGDQKACLVFLRLKDPLPGARAFSKHAKKDSRINFQRLTALHGPFPTSPAGENALWYKLYREHRDEVTVTKSHKDFLLARDIVCMTFLFLVFAGIPMLFLGAFPISLYYLLALVLEFFLIVRVAQNHGKRFVTNVLSIEAAK